MVDMTPKEVAQELRIGKLAVQDLITTGQLRAYDAAPSDAKRRRYRVTRESLDNFKQGRLIKQPVTVEGLIENIV